MSGQVVKVLPMLLASVGLFAGTGPAHKKHDKKAGDCASLCHPNPKLECDTPWDVNASATYLQVRVQGGDIGVLTNDRTIIAYPVAATGIQPADSFAWGFQVGAGYSFHNDNWKVSANYQNYKCITDTSLELSYGQAFAPSLYVNQKVNNPTNTLLFNNLQSGINMSYNNVEVLLDRATMITPNLEITTLFGVNVQLMQRRQLSVFTNALTDTATSGYGSNIGGYFQNYQKYTWWGVGPEIGMHTNWAIGNNVSFFGDAYGSITYGYSNTRNATFSKVVAFMTGTTPMFLPTEAAVQNGLYQYSPSVKYLLGFSWFKTMENDSRVTLKMAYQSEYLFYLIKSIVPRADFATSNGSGFGIQGIVFNAALDF